MIMSLSVQAQLDDVKSLGESPSLTSLLAHSESEGGKHVQTGRLCTGVRTSSGRRTSFLRPPRRESAANVQPRWNQEYWQASRLRILCRQTAGACLMPRSTSNENLGHEMPLRRVSQCSTQREQHTRLSCTASGFRKLRGDCLTRQAATFVEPRFRRDLAPATDDAWVRNRESMTPPSRRRWRLAHVWQRDQHAYLQFVADMSRLS